MNAACANFITAASVNRLPIIAAAPSAQWPDWNAATNINHFDEKPLSGGMPASDRPPNRKAPKVKGMRRPSPPSSSSFVAWLPAITAPAARNSVSFSNMWLTKCISPPATPSDVPNETAIST